MCDKKKINGNIDNYSYEIRHDGFEHSSYHGYERIYENVGTDTTKPFDISLMTGNSTSNNGNKKR